MKKLSKVLTMLLILGVFSSAGVAVAAPVTVSDLFGDQDGFGIGVLDGQDFDWSLIGGADADGLTDTWVTNNQSWAHTYDLSGISTLTSAYLEVFTGGAGTDGTFGPADLLIDGTLVGQLTVGYNPISGYNKAVKDVYDLMPFSSLLVGANTILVSTGLDSWALDYSLLSLEGTATVPEPSTLLLFGTGLMGIGIFRRKFKG